MSVHANVQLRHRVKALYRDFIRLGRAWQAVDAKNTADERQYIAEETRRLFRENAHLKTEQEIEERVLEAEARLEMARHYKNPYPRMTNVPPFTMAAGKGRQGSEQRRQHSLPTHLKSYHKP
ncbi:LYR motif containing protein 1-like [Paramacrobiotus metropolitanus]|uniref:LYR motif containing protein 1-like n=1 Tax=Paramacrobiotus metropolitanus TaxID=2943436 RepID=UPI0024461840|nr:LYR motif containing protein 1-like [Paramacrobiotus metropolitanus]